MYDEYISLLIYLHSRVQYTLYCTPYNISISLVSAVWDSMDMYDEYWLLADRDRDGFITRKEFEMLLRAHGYSRTDIEVR